MKTLFFLCALLAVISAYSPEHVGDKWQKQTAEQKFSALNKQCLADTSPLGWFSVRLAELFLEDMNASFDKTEDDMPAQTLGLEQRPKVIHTVGSIAKAKWVSVGNHNYTGIFKGCENAYLRCSLAKKPSAKPANYVPGVSMKFLRDNVPSANLFAMYSLEGQSSFNFFEHDLTNHVGDLDPANIDFALKKLKEAFMKASKWPTMLGLNRMSTFDENGQAQTPPNFPFRLVFHPTTAIHSVIDATPVDDELIMIKQFEKVGNPGHVYDVYAQATPFDESLEKIGEVHTLSAFSSTKYGDESLFFQHTRMEEDVESHPDWSAEIEKILAHQRSVPHYTYPDLPFN